MWLWECLFSFLDLVFIYRKAIGTITGFQKNPKGKNGLKARLTKITNKDSAKPEVIMFGSDA